jgi:hypothetical protein
MRIIAELACRTNGWTSPSGSEFKVTTSWHHRGGADGGMGKPRPLDGKRPRERGNWGAAQHKREGAGIARRSEPRLQPEEKGVNGKWWRGLRDGLTYFGTGLTSIF